LLNGSYYWFSSSRSVGFLTSTYALILCTIAVSASIASAARPADDVP